MNAIVFALTIYATGMHGEPLAHTVAHFETASDCAAQGIVAKRAARRAGLRRIVASCVQAVVPVPDAIPGPQGVPGPRGRDGRDCRQEWHARDSATGSARMPESGPAMGASAAPPVHTPVWPSW